MAEILTPLTGTAAPSPRTIAWCEARGHPWSTYNPWLDRTWCRCGARQSPGEQPIDFAALHAISHDCPYGTTVCTCYVDRAARSRTASAIPRSW